MPGRGAVSCLVRMPSGDGRKAGRPGCPPALRAWRPPYPVRHETAREVLTTTRSWDVRPYRIGAFRGNDPITMVGADVPGSLEATEVNAKERHRARLVQPGLVRSRWV